MTPLYPRPAEFARELDVLDQAADFLAMAPECDPVTYLRAWAQRLRQIGNEQ